MPCPHVSLLNRTQKLGKLQCACVVRGRAMYELTKQEMTMPAYLTFFKCTKKTLPTCFVRTLYQVTQIYVRWVVVMQQQMQI